MLKFALEKLMRGINLSREESQKFTTDLLTQEINPCQAAAFLALLHAKPETVDEMIGIIEAMRAVMNKVEIAADLRVLDLVGTGGDKAKTINISTTASLLAASCGVKIIKHGNRSVSSLCGSADVLEALGVNIHLTANEVIQSVQKVGIAFCFAPNFHPAFLKLRDIRKSLGITTSFNLIAPLLNPANPAHLMVGVFDEKYVDLLAEVLFQLGTERSLVFHGCGGLDEITCLGPTRAIEVTAKAKRSIVIDPKELGFNLCELSDLQGHDAKINSLRIREVLNGQESPLSDTIILNAAVAMWIYGSFVSIAEAIPYARENLRNKKAQKLLENWSEAVL